MRQKIVAGNWKMNGQKYEIVDLLQQIKTRLNEKEQQRSVVFPPSIYIPLVQEILEESMVQWGGQNFYPQDKGAFTGEISAPMLVDYGCRFVLVGHSERRQIFNESEKFVAEKFHQAKEHGMIPVLCVGETWEQREKEQTLSVLEQQIAAVTKKSSNWFDKAIIAYEPVWAIGTGKTASPEQVQLVHKAIREIIEKFDSCQSEKVTILYGGSVNEKNAASLFEMPDVDGGLIGGASLNAQQFVEIVKCIK